MSEFSVLADIASKFLVHTNRKLLHGATGGLVALMTIAPLPATAGLILSGDFVVGGSGFGSLPRALTVDAHGSANTESGCIAPGSSLIAGPSACAGSSTGGDEANPIGFPKQSAPSLSLLGITNADQIGILFDAVQPQSGNNPTVTINDLTLKLYDSGYNLLTTAVLIPDDLMLATNPGNGNTDYLFILDAASITDFNAYTGAFLALDATLSFSQNGGPESFALVNKGDTPIIDPRCVNGTCPIPEPGSLGLVATGLFALFGLFGLGKVRRNVKLAPA